MTAITMHHTQSGRTQRASRAAYDEVWAADGWVLVDEPETTVDEPAAPKSRRSRKPAKDESE